MGKLTIASPNRPTLNVYTDKLFSSAVVGLMQFGQNYPYTTLEDNWYRVTLPDNSRGWVNAPYVKITP
jgi:hypothetical protein